MNKQNLILWSGAVLVVFLAGYFKTLTSSSFPLSGTIGIEGRRVTYHLEQRAHIKDTMTILLRTDVKELAGKLTLLAQNGKDSAVFPFYPYADGQFLKTAFPVYHLPSSVSYTITLNLGNKQYLLPYNSKSTTVVCLPEIPRSISSVYYLTLYLGLLLALRNGLEFFGTGKKIKTRALFITICFALYGFFIVPVINLYESNAVNRLILQPAQLFSKSDLLFSLLWIAGTIIIFRSNNRRAAAALLGIATLLIFLLT